jgi:hypothetical protein
VTFQVTVAGGLNCGAVFVPPTVAPGGSVACLAYKVPPMLASGERTAGELLQTLPLTCDAGAAAYPTKHVPIATTDPQTLVSGPNVTAFDATRVGLNGATEVGTEMVND